jgi:hypothetical protein
MVVELLPSLVANALLLLLLWVKGPPSRLGQAGKVRTAGAEKKGDCAVRLWCQNFPFSLFYGKAGRG